MDYIICHYGEIGLKGKNRKFFEEKLVKNIKLALGPSFFKYVHPVKSRKAGAAKPQFNRVKRISGRIIVKSISGSPSSEADRRRVSESLTKVFGIQYFAFSESCEQNIEAIKNKALEILKSRNFKSFKINTQRSKKDFPLTSQEINEKVGEHILKKLKVQKAKFKVDLKNPDITLFIEIVEKYAFLYTEKIKGPGGLPIGVSGKAVALLSGGIDSPVASYLAMKRGLQITAVHFHALPFTNRASIDKVKKILTILLTFQKNIKLYLVPFADIQKEIVLKTAPKLRVILYRRMMFRIAQEIAKKERAGAIVTGENLGQVASQTLENLRVIEKAANLLVLRPLIGDDKSEIIEKAKKIKTFEISILPHQDCCSRFVPVHPETRANIEEVEREEKKLNIEKLISKALPFTAIDNV